MNVIAIKGLVESGGQLRQGSIPIAHNGVRSDGARVIVAIDSALPLVEVSIVLGVISHMLGYFKESFALCVLTPVYHSGPVLCDAQRPEIVQSSISSILV